MLEWSRQTTSSSPTASQVRNFEKPRCDTVGKNTRYDRGRGGDNVALRRSQPLASGGAYIYLEAPVLTVAAEMVNPSAFAR